jgi:hypothetical protein
MKGLDSFPRSQMIFNRSELESRKAESRIDVESNTVDLSKAFARSSFSSYFEQILNSVANEHRIH